MSVPAGRAAIHAVAVVLALGLAMSVALTPASAAAPAQDSFDELYERGQKANAAMKTLTARFTETTTSTLLTRPLVSRGRLFVERPARVILRYTDPDARVVLIDGNKMTMTWPGRNISQTIDIGTTQRRIQKYFVNGTAAELRREFDIDDRVQGNQRPNAYYVSMAPRRKQMREALTRLELWVGRTSMLLEGMKMTFANGDSKMMAFEDVVPNTPLEAGTFNIDR